MAGQNINQYVYPNYNPKLSLESFDVSLTSDETGFNLESVFSPYLIAQTYGKKLPINFDINNPLSAQQLILTKGTYNPSNIFVSTNYYTTENESLSCYTQHSSCDIGLTGIDNGLVSGMTGQTIYFTNGLVDDINKFNRFYFDKRLKLFQVTGHTSTNIRFSGFNDTLVYDIESATGVTEGVYHNLYGGFYQGFYKLFGYDYNILPDRVNKGWTVEMLLRPRITASTVNSGETTLNELYPNNKNTFFFLGARAENKFYHHADGTPNCFTGYTRVTENLTKLETCACCNKTVTNSRCIYVYPPRSAGGVHDVNANYGCSQCNGNTMVQTSCGCGCDKIACQTCGWECQVHECSTIVEVTPTPTPTPTSTSTGCVIPPVCTPTCNTCDNCTNCDTCVYTGFSSIENTCETDPMYDWLSNNISLRLCGDPKNPGIGVRALRMTGDCSTNGTCGDTGKTYTTGYTVVDYCSPPIYDYLTTYCNSEEPTILDIEHWIQVNVVWERYSWYSPEELCGKGGLNLFSKEVYLQSLAGNTSSLISPPYTNSEQVAEKIEIISVNENWLKDKNDRRGRLKIFINGYLHHTIDDFEEVIPRGLSTDKEKQVGVPFNISWGGGSQGLIENLTFTSMSALTGPYQQDPECLTTNDLTGTTFSGLSTNIVIEKYFAGTFEGGISQFRFYIEPLSAGEVRHNFRLLQGKFELLNRSCPGCSANDGGENCSTDEVEFVIGTPTMTPSHTKTPAITKTPAPTKTQTKTPVQTKTPQVTSTQTPQATRTPLSTSTPTKTNIPTQTVTRTQTKTPTLTPTITNTPNGNYYNYNLCDTQLFTTNGPTGTYTYEIYVGYDVGIVTLNFQAGNIPSRFQIQWDSNLVADSGFRGNPIYNSQLNSLGYPNVVGTSIGNISFNKNIVGPETLFIIITSPIGPVNFNFNVTCPPIPTPTPTVTKTPTNTPTITKTLLPTPTLTQTITKTSTQTPSPTFVHSFTGNSECNVQNQVISGFSGEYVYEIALGTGIGPVGLNFDAINVPDKFTVIWDGVEVINTGFRGLSFYNPQLAALGYPPVSGPGSGYTTFVKSSSTPTEAFVHVLAPISNTAWRFTLECPILPTPTVTPTKTITPTLPRISFLVYSGNSESSSCYGTESTVIYGFIIDFDYNTEFYNNPYGPVTEDMSGFYNFNGAVVELNSEGVVIGLFELCLTPTPTPTTTSTPTITPTSTTTPTETPTQTVTVSITETFNYLSPTPNQTETVTPTITQTPTLTETPSVTSSPTKTIGFYTYTLGSGLTATESCENYYSSPFTLYGPLAGGMGPNVGEFLYQTPGNPPSNPVPDGYYSNGNSFFIVSGGTGQIVATDAEGCIGLITPTPTPSVTQTLTPTNTNTVTSSPTPSVTLNTCLCFVLSNATLSQITVEYVDCYGNSTSVLVDPESSYNLCGQSVIDAGPITYYQNGYCSDLGEGFGCDYIGTLTPTPTPTLTPTPQSQFKSIWTANSPISLPYSPTGTYSGTIDWGDGSVSDNTYDNRTHNYVSSGDYLITITGVIEGFNFGSYGDGYNESIKEILSFGPLKVESNDFINMFSGCSNLTLSAVTDTLDTSYGLVFDAMFYGCSSLTTVPNMGNWDMSSAISMTSMFNSCTQFNENINDWDISNVSDISTMFLNASSFNQPLSGWNTSYVGAMVGTFENATSFNQDIGMWNISLVYDMQFMLDNTNIDINNYSNILIGFAYQEPFVPSGITFGASNLVYSASTAQYARDLLTNPPYSWTIIDSGGVGPLLTPTPTPSNTPTITVSPTQILFTPSVTQTNTPTPTNVSNNFVSIWSGSSVTLPYLSGGTYSGTIDWGDGSVSANTFANITHTYSGDGLYTITIDGEITGFNFGLAGDRLKIREILSWGRLRGLNNRNQDMFSFCSNLVLTGVTGIIDLSGITATTSMFASCTSITTINNLNNWNMSGVTQINAMFDSCVLFNQDISGWDVSNVTNMNALFAGCLNFNQNINSWTTSAVTSMSSIFINATSFNYPLSGWNISNVTNMVSMLNGCGMSISNYSNTLIGWASQVPSIQNNVTLGADNLYYSATTAQSSRDILTNSPYNWTIIDSGPIDITPTPTITSTSTLTPTPTRSPKVVPSTPTNTPTLTVTPTETVTLTPSITLSETPTSTPTPTTTSGSTPSCPYEVGYFSTTDNVYRFDVNTNNGQIYVVTTGGTEVYGSNYSYIETLPNSLSGGPANYASLTFANDGVSELLYVGSDSSNKSVDLYNLTDLTATTINIGTSITEIDVDRVNTFIGMLTDNVDYKQINISSQSVTATIDVTATTNGDIAWSRQNDRFWVVSTGNTIYYVDPTTKGVTGSDPIPLGGFSGIGKRLLYDVTNSYMYLLVDGYRLITYSGPGVIDSVINLTSYSGTNTSMTIDQVNNKLYILNVDGSVFGLIKIDIGTLTDEGLTTLNNYVGFTDGFIVYETNNTEILLNFVPYSPRIYRFCT